MTTDELVTNEDVQEEAEPRTISQLLALNTYQGMTDAEIDTIIAYKVSIELQSEINTATLNANQAAANEIIRLTEESLYDSIRITNEILGRPLQLTEVGLDE